MPKKAMMPLVSRRYLFDVTADPAAFVQEEQAIESVDQSGAENVRVHWQVCLTRLFYPHTS